MSESTHVRGTRGEQMAARFLTRKGYTIFHCNYRDKISRNEIDLITRQDDCIVSVEVNTGSALAFGDPVTWVTWMDIRKQRCVTHAVSRYIRDTYFCDSDCRIEVIGITVDRGLSFIKHLEHTSTGIMQ